MTPRRPPSPADVEVSRPDKLLWPEIGVAKREYVDYLAAVAESGLREEEATGTPTAPAVQVMTISAARGLEFAPCWPRGDRRSDLTMS